MKKFFTVLALAGVCGALCSAESPLKISGVSDVTINYNSSRVKDAAGGLAFTIGNGHVQLISKKSIPIDLSKKYLVSCEYRLAPGTQEGCSFYFAPVSYSSKGQLISCESQYIVEGSESELAAPVKKGDRVIKVKDCSKWTQTNGVAAFDAKKDLSDLPNFKTSRIASIKKAGDCWEVSLKQPAADSYPAGTCVRNHKDGATYRYIGALIKPKAQWQKASRVVSGAIRERANGYIMTWRPGTAKAGLILFSGPGKGTVEVRNITISEVK